MERKDAVDLSPGAERMIDPLSKLIRLLELPGLKEGDKQQDQENRSGRADPNHSPAAGSLSRQRLC